MKQIPAAALLTTTTALTLALSASPIKVASPDTENAVQDASTAAPDGRPHAPETTRRSPTAADPDPPLPPDRSGGPDGSPLSSTARQDATRTTSRARAAVRPTGPCALSGAAGGAGGGVSESATTPPGFVHPTGRVRALTVLIDFPDAPARISARSRYGEFFPAVPDYFRASSHGRLDYRSTPVLKWIRMSRSLASYGIKRGTPFDAATGNGYAAVAKEIVRAVDRDVDFRRYGLINVLVTPNAGPPATEDVWSVTFSGGGLGIGTRDGTQLKNVSFIWSRQTGPSAFRVLNHENAHSFGLPDLYFTDGRAASHPVGHWDPMDVDWGPNNDFLGWHKWKFGWLSRDQVDCVNRPGSVTEHRLVPLATRGGTKITVIPVSRRTAYVVEARRRGGLDPTACRPGVLVYRVATDVSSGNGPIRVADATPGSGGCYRGDSNVIVGLTDATYRPGQTFSSARRDGVSVSVLREDPDGAFRIRVSAPDEK